MSVCPALETSAESVGAWRILPMRHGAVLLELADLKQTLALYDALCRQNLAGIREIIPAARTVMIEFDPALLSLETLATTLRGLDTAETASQAGACIEIPVRYDGEDLSDVAEVLNMSPEEVVRRHTGHDYLVAFTGFAPGFAYLAEGDPRLVVPRRKSPRTLVPAGSVGLAGAFSGIYPKASPGGWQLIGTTPLALFDIDRQPAALLQPGQRVRFVDMAKDAAYAVQGDGRETSFSKRATAPGAQPGNAIEVLSVGLPVLFQDLGRAGLVAQGISRSGAADRESLKAANRLVGNPAETAALEITLGGFSFRMRGQGVMAVAGALVEITITTAAGGVIKAPHHAAVALEEGDSVTLSSATVGLRAYLALRGGFDIAPVLASRSTDMLAQIGPEPLKAGEVVAIANAPSGSPVALAETPAFVMPRAGEVVTLDIVFGPRTDWFTEASVTRFLSQEWAVSAQSSRVGIRLEGEALERKVTGELPSEATLRGAIQVPASGQPVLFLVDHPLTGGYPVIGNVAGHHLDLAGQIPPGARIRFRAAAPFAPHFLQGQP
ncbi:5-oxoprolinase subunit PxpB [Rhizobium sp. SGZ-381]|uniref:5-oxoprolinase subunit PxpB n=1 Tax=Rhizobium sp. SGZ-381 TaxID=3342800 RepID=UPI00366A8E2C